MSPAEFTASAVAREKAAVARERAAQDLQDIAELERTQGWTRYWVPRINRRIESHWERVKHESPKTCDATEREIVRRVAVELEEILGLLAKDRGVAKALVNQPQE